MGGIVEARAEHKNFITKYHRSFCSNVQIVQNVQMLCAKQESFFAQENKGEIKWSSTFFQCQFLMNLIIGTIFRLFIDYLDFKSYKSRIIIKGL